jgi:DNA invertase Pin-like site-specific DNA recombinase
VTSDKFIAYYRVSTQRQGASGLGLDAQKETVATYVKNVPGSLVAEFCEVETGRGVNALAKRPQLREALDRCKREGAVLVIAKLDRLARNVHFISGLMESRVRFVACDMPEANELTLHVLAAFAEHEAKRISQRTKEALAQAQARGVKLGKTGFANFAPALEVRRTEAAAFLEELRGLFDGMRLRGLSRRQMVAELNRLGIRARRGGPWSLCQVQRVSVALASSPDATHRGFNRSATASMPFDPPVQRMFPALRKSLTNHLSHTPRDGAFW